MTGADGEKPAENETQPQNKSEHSAKDFVRFEVGRWLSVDDPDIRQSAGEMALWWGGRCEYEKSCTGSIFVNAPPQNIESFYELAKHSSDARKILMRIVGSKLLAHVPLSNTEATFAGLALEGLLPDIPKRRGVKRAKLDERNIFIISMMDALEKSFGLTPLRNDATQNSNSAADLLAEIFNEHGRYEVTFRVIKEVWTNKKVREGSRALMELVEARAKRG